MEYTTIDVLLYTRKSENDSSSRVYCKNVDEADKNFVRESEEFFETISQYKWYMYGLFLSSAWKKSVVIDEDDVDELCNAYDKNNSGCFNMLKNMLTNCAPGPFVTYFAMGEDLVEKYFDNEYINAGSGYYGAITFCDPENQKAFERGLGVLNGYKEYTTIVFGCDAEIPEYESWFDLKNCLNDEYTISDDEIPVKK